MNNIRLLFLYATHEKHYKTPKTPVTYGNTWRTPHFLVCAQLPLQFSNHLPHMFGLKNICET